MNEVVLGIPTIRQKAYEAAREYAENLERYGHGGTTILVAGDAPAGANGVLVAGLAAVAQACPGAAAILQPGYGGNRNGLLLATLGQRLLSVDDDVHPYGLFREPARSSAAALDGAFVGKGGLDRIPQVDFDLQAMAFSMQPISGSTRLVSMPR
jgi:hypothetical protein